MTAAAVSRRAKGAQLDRAKDITINQSPDVDGDKWELSFRGRIEQRSGAAGRIPSQRPGAGQLKTGQLVRPGGKTHRVGGGNEKPDAGICRVGLVKVKVGAPTIGAETLNMCARMPGARINPARHRAAGAAKSHACHRA